MSRIDDPIRCLGPLFIPRGTPLKRTARPAVSKARSVSSVRVNFSACTLAVQALSWRTYLRTQADLQQYEFTGVLGNPSRFSVFFLFCWHVKAMIIIIMGG
jgi:hypothetical protein